MERRVINPWKWQDAFGFVQANEVTGGQRTLICAGQASAGDDGVPLHAGDMKAQTTQALDNLETVLKQAGFSLADVVRMNIYTTDVDRFMAEGAAVWGRRLAESGCRPAATLLGISRLAYPELLIELEATAMS
jgi:enamine deaminase RidA (YjgF/YER057c/UK114 family)